MLILGINAYHADASAAIFKNGKIVAAIEEERFTRIKHWAGFPTNAIKFCLNEADAALQDVDLIAIGRNPNAKLKQRLKFVLQHPVTSGKAVRERWNNRAAVKSVENALAAIGGGDPAYYKKRMVHVEHHRSHLASAFFASPFEEAAVVSIDGSGDFSTTMHGFGRANNLFISDSIDFPHSIGIFYSAFTQLLGFPYYGDEYKVMGMAPYGKPVYKSLLDDVIVAEENGKFRLNLSYFTNMAGNILNYENEKPVVSELFGPKMEEIFGRRRQGNTEPNQIHKNLAASVQSKTEEIIFHVLNFVQTTSQLQNLCLAGGVAQNSVVNGKITANTKFRKVYIPPAAHDAGISMGAALYVQHVLKNMERSHLEHGLIGSCYATADTMLKIPEDENIVVEKLSDEEILKTVTDELMNGGVVGWFKGRSEFGPRALGARSILADPRRANAREIINLKIKRRESFRPFAPSILQEFTGEYFEENDEVPFMEKVVKVREEKRSEIPAVVHVDGTGRLQTVSKKHSPAFYAVINEFYKKTGVPVLLNTSFNENEPIVNTPQQAFDCFYRTEMDMLVIENLLIKRINS